MTRRIQILILNLLLAILISCESSPNGVEVQGPSSHSGSGNSNMEKPTSAPQRYTLEQFQEGQSIIWMRKAKPNKTGCVRWTWVKVGATVNFHTIKGDSSRDCKTWPMDQIRTIKYRPDTGEVLTDYIQVDGDTIASPNKLATIFEHLYGSEEKVSFKETQHAFAPDWKLPVFTVSGKTQLFLNKPGHPFHGVALKWTEKEDKVFWEYQVLDVVPELPSL